MTYFDIKNNVQNLLNFKLKLLKIRFDAVTDILAYGDYILVKTIDYMQNSNRQKYIQFISFNLLMCSSNEV